MSIVQFFLLSPTGPTPLPVSPAVESVHDLFDGLPLGVYTTLCTFEHNKFLYLEAHLDRLQNSVKLMGWDYDLDRPLLRQMLHQLCTAYPLPDSRVRLDVLAEPISIPEMGISSRLTLALSPFPPIPPEIYEQGVEVGLADELRREKPLIKDANFVLQRRPFLSAGVYEQLLIDEEGHLLEGMTSNLYGVRDGVLWTAGTGVLEGVARRIVLQQAEALNIPVRLEAIKVEEIETLDEAALSSASRALVPVVRIGGEMIGDGRSGPITRRLLEGYRAFLGREIRAAVDS
jgi:branched-chain amino acid aminotransferase